MNCPNPESLLGCALFPHVSSLEGVMSSVLCMVGHGRVRGWTLDGSEVVRLVESSAGIPSAARGKKGTYPCHETGAPQPKTR